MDFHRLEQHPKLRYHWMGLTADQMLQNKNISELENTAVESNQMKQGGKKKKEFIKPL